MIKILHASDFHLDSPFESLPAEKAALRRSEQREMLAVLIELANSGDVDIVLLPGDLLDSDNTYYETADLLPRLFAKTKAKIFISPGNHDYYCANSPYAALPWPGNVHIFKTSSISSVFLPELNCIVYGAAFQSSLCAHSMLQGFCAEDGEAVRIMALHGELNSAESRYNPITADEITKSNLDYLALGHTHSFNGIQKAGKTSYAYCGCPAGRSFLETGQKGVILGMVGRDAVQLDFMPVPSRRYEALEIVLTSETPALDQITARLPRDSSQDIYQITLTGETSEALESELLQDRLSDRFFSLIIRDRTKIYRDLWTDAGSDTLKGIFLARLKAQYDCAETDGEKKQIRLAAKFGLAALDNREVLEI